jgi:hypothetical protein
MAPPVTESAAEPVRYIGTEQADATHDGGLRWAVGVKSWQAFRANRARPELAEDFGWTYNHAPLLAYWRDRFWIEYLSAAKDENRGPMHTLLMSSADGINWANKVTLGDTTFHRPALTVYNGQIVLAWTGTDSARRLNIIRSRNGTTWTGKLTLGDTSINGPDLCALGGSMLLTWTGTDAGRRLNVMAFNGAAWFNKVTLGENSIAGPSIENVGGNVILSWTGTDARNSLNTLRSTNGVNYFGKRTYGDTSSYGPTVNGMQGAPVITWTGKDAAQSLNVMRI